MELAKIGANFHIDFPPTIREWLRTESELAVFLTGDTLVLKKIHAPKLSDFAARVATGEMPMSEIVAEVHRYRDEKDAE